MSSKGIYGERTCPVHPELVEGSVSRRSRTIYGELSRTIYGERTCPVHPELVEGSISRRSRTIYGELSRTIVSIVVLAVFCFCCGCVERKLTIVTEPSGALVSLNDEEIGVSPVTVGFEWYGDYSVRISKDGYQTLITHQKLKRPIKDVFPFDLFADMFTTKIDEYTWTFKLKPYQQVRKDELIKSAVSLQKETLAEPNKPAPKKSKTKAPKPAEKVKMKKQKPTPQSP